MHNQKLYKFYDRMHIDFRTFVCLRWYKHFLFLRCCFSDIVYFVYVFLQLILTSLQNVLKIDFLAMKTEDHQLMKTVRSVGVVIHIPGLSKNFIYMVPYQKETTIPHKTSTLSRSKIIQAITWVLSKCGRSEMK